MGEVAAALITLTIMEIILGVDNIVFIAILSEKLPESQRILARRLGLGIALAMRVLMLLALTQIKALDTDAFEAFGHAFTWKDLVLVAGGGFLVYKGTHEIHKELEGSTHAEDAKKSKASSFTSVVAMIVAMDLVFSLDSVLAAVGMAKQVWVMITAVSIAMTVMLTAAGPISRFVHRHPTTKMLALAFLILIGVLLVADGFGEHIPRGYVYAAMGFSVFVEALNLAAKKKRTQPTDAQLEPNASDDRTTKQEQAR